MQKSTNTAIKNRLNRALWLLAWLFIGMSPLRAQDNVYISPGGGVGFFQDTVMIYGKLTVNQGTLFFNSNARVFFFGDTAKILPGSTVSNPGHFIFKGPRPIPTSSSFTQYLDAGGTQLGSIVIDNTKDVHLVNTNAGALDTLRFVNGKLFLNGNNFTVGSGNPGVIDGYTENRFVVTNGALNATSGFLIRDMVGSNTAVFPIGPHAAAYEPGSISNTGTPDLMRMRISPEVYEFVSSGLQQNDRSTQTTWFLEEGTPGGSNATVQLQHNNWHEGAHFTNYRPYHFISRYVGFTPNTEGDTLSLTNWDNFQKSSTQAGVTPGFLTTGAPVTSGIVTTRTGLTYFGPMAKTVWNDPFMIIPLPIEFLDVAASWKTESTAKVTWTVGDDQQARSYTVERVLPGESKYTAIRTVPAMGMQGQADYSINDVLSDITGTILYRVVANNQNGSKTESKTVSLQRNISSTEIVMAPNPSTKYVDIKTYGTVSGQESLNVEIYSNAGVLVNKSADPNGQQLRINTENWAEGVYVVRITLGAQTQIQKLMVIHGQ